MRKILFLLFPVFVAFFALGCSGEEMPCATCSNHDSSLPLPPVWWQNPSQSSSSFRYSSSSSSFRSSSSSISYQTLDGCPNVSVGVNTVSCGSPLQTYRTVTINGQVWMAENLNYNASGSRCYGDDTGGDSQNKCGTYGRLYNWATAMGISSSYNSSYYYPSDSYKYRGVCPQGWHIPNDSEWSALISYVESSKGCSSCAAKYLKSTSGWSSCSASGSSYSCLDSYGFSALPGGYGSSYGGFYDVGNYGRWWSASENNSFNAYNRYMSYDSENAYYNDRGKSYLFSVRCLQDYAY